MQTPSNELVLTFELLAALQSATLGLEHMRQPYQVNTNAYESRSDSGAYTVRGFPSTGGGSGDGGVVGMTGTYVTGSAPLSGGYGGAASASVYGSSGGGASVQLVVQPSPQAQQQVLTQPSVGVSNDGWDNENSDLIITVGDALTNSTGVRSVCKPGL